MDLATLLKVAIRASVVLTVFGLALGATVDGAWYLLRRPGLLARSLLAMNVVMPLAAVALATTFALDPAAKITLVALALAPVPPILPKKQERAGGEADYAVSLLVTAALLAIVFVPAAMALLGRAFGLSAYVPVGPVAKLVTITVLAPLAAGLLVRRLAPSLAQRLVGPISKIAAALLIVAAVAILLATGPAIVALIGHGTVVAFAAFSVVGLVIGHLLGGPGAAERVVLALATALRHPGVAVAIATAAFPEQRRAVPAVGLYLLVAGITSALYLMWLRRRRPELAARLDRGASKRPAA
jgi:bile acid:Na+ symporter, BASS family